jgi:glycosyltransferase involved in cell wall biosynthesis
MTHFPGIHMTESIHLKNTLNGQGKPLVSVIIPTYNHAYYVAEAIRSVLNQDYDRYEIILVDDGSTDNTSEVVAQFGFKVRYIYQPNQGLSAARNIGLRLARGDLIGFLDADDLYEPDYLSTLVSLLTANPQADAIHCACRFVDRFNNPLPQVAGRVIPPDQLYATLLKGNFIPPLCMFAYKYCYEKAGLFDRSFQGVADWEMWLRISGSFTVIATEQVLARYRVAPNSMSSDISPMLEERLNVLGKHMGFNPPGSSSLSQVELEAYSRVYLRTAIEYLQIKDQDQAYQCLYEALDILPSLVQFRDIYYEMAWGATPRGYRVDFAILDLLQNAQVLLRMLDRLFSDPQLSVKLKAYRNNAYTNAYLVLSQLSYGKGNFGETRKYWLHALKSDIFSAFSSPYINTLIKSLIGVNLINQIRGLKSRIINRNDLSKEGLEIERC